MFTGKGYLLYKLRRWLLPLITALPLGYCCRLAAVLWIWGSGPLQPTFGEDLRHSVRPVNCGWLPITAGWPLSVCRSAFGILAKWL